jgi:hypothetical protein
METSLGNEELIEISNTKIQSGAINIGKICELLIDEQCKITVIKISTDLPKQISKDLYKALSKNNSVTELKCQNYESEDLGYLKALKKNTRIRSII